MRTFGYYVQCPACGRVVHSEHGKLSRLDEPAPCCGASGKVRTIWPSLEVHKFLQMAAAQDLDSDKERPVAIVFLCTALELLLEHAIWMLLSIHAKSQRLAEYVLDSNQGRKRRIDVYNKLSDCPLGDLFQSQNMSTFLDDWAKLSDFRNQVVHGRYYTGGAKETDLIQRVQKDCLKAFADVHNDVQRMIDQAAGKAIAVTK